MGSCSNIVMTGLQIRSFFRFETLKNEIGNDRSSTDSIENEMMSVKKDK